MSMLPLRAERSVQRQAGADASFRASLVVVELVARVCMKERGAECSWDSWIKGWSWEWIVNLIVYEYHQIFAYTYVHAAPQASCVPPEALSEQSPRCLPCWTREP